jgi:WD40 repeat protein
MVKIRADKQEEHQSEVQFITVNEKTGCFITGGADGLVKLWTKDKRLLVDFDFFEAPRSVLFSNDQFRVFLGHKNSVSELTNCQLLESAQKIWCTTRHRPKLRLYVSESSNVHTTVEFLHNSVCFSKTILPLRLIACDFNPRFVSNETTFDDVQVLIYEDTEFKRSRWRSQNQAKDRRI